MPRQPGIPCRPPKKDEMACEQIVTCADEVNGQLEDEMKYTHAVELPDKINDERT